MNATKNDRIRYQKAKGLLVFGAIEKPFTKINRDGTYVAVIRMTADEAKPILAELTALAQTKLADQPDKDQKAFGKVEPSLPIKAERDRETDELTGFYVFSANQAARVMGKNGANAGKVISFTIDRVDSKGNALPASLQIGNGSRIQLGVTLRPYFKSAAEPKDRKWGLSANLQAVRVLDFKARSNSFNFEGEAEDGYVFAGGESETVGGAGEAAAPVAAAGSSDF